MRKAREYWWILLAVILFPVMSGGCGGGDGNAVRSVTATGRPAALLGDIPDLDFIPAFESRLTKKTKDVIADDTEIVVLHDWHVASLSDAQKAGLKKVYDGGGVVVLIEPTYEELVKLSGVVKHDLKAAEDKGADHFCDMYAFNNDWHTYVVGHTHSDPPKAGEDEFSDDAAKKAYYEGLMDNFVEWIDNNGPHPKPSSPNFGNDGTSRIENLVKAQTVTFNDTHTLTLGAVHFITGLTNTYFIYALYDFDHDYDYYVFDHQATVINGPMFKGHWNDGETDWWGCWLYFYQASHALKSTGGTPLTPAVCNALQPRPTTSIGTTSYTVSQSYSWSGSLGFSGTGATGGLSGSASYSSSNTTDLSDIRINYVTGATDEGTTWQYQVQNLPTFIDKSRILNGITDPPLIAVNTAVFYDKWIWMIREPKKNGGKFDASCLFIMNYTCDTAKVLYGSFKADVTENLLIFPAFYPHTINLTPPPREKTPTP